MSAGKKVAEMKNKMKNKNQMKNKKQMKNHWKQICAGLLTAALTGTVLPPQTVYADTEPVTTPEVSAVTGRLEFEEAAVIRVISDGSSGSQANGTANTLRSVREQLWQYDWDCYSNDYYYSKLTQQERLLYERMDAVCGQLLGSESLAAATYEVNRNGKKAEGRGTKMISTQGLSSDQVKTVYELFIYANPQYYFLSNTRYVKTGEMALGIYDAFASGSARARATKQVFAKVAAMQRQINATGTVYDTELQIHELICDEVDYQTADYAVADTVDPYYTQTIYGALTTGKTVCAGYTKLYELLCNYFGIDCIAVTSDDHAWNLVRYGTHWYIVDTTWDDSYDRNAYFHISEHQMRRTDQADSHVAKSLYAGLMPTADAAFPESLKSFYGLEQPLVQITDTADGLTITMDSAAGSVYYTLDGTEPGVEDVYVDPIELRDAGDYIVTAVTMKDGSLPSAYEIFPVRIADGSVSVQSVKNLQGKQLRVLFRADGSYDGYEISYASKRDFSNQKSAKIGTAAARIKKLVIGKTYYVRVRGYRTDAYGNYYYTPYSKAKKMKVTR